MADDPDEGGNPRMALIGLVAVVVIFGPGRLVAHALYNSTKMEDCLMSGRSNCQTIQAPAH
jgi:hypothetical protein